MTSSLRAVEGRIRLGFDFIRGRGALSFCAALVTRLDTPSAPSKVTEARPIEETWMRADLPPLELQFCHCMALPEITGE